MFLIIRRLFAWPKDTKNLVQKPLFLFGVGVGGGGGPGVTGSRRLGARFGRLAGLVRGSGRRGRRVVAFAEQVREPVGGRGCEVLAVYSAHFGGLAARNEIFLHALWAGGSG